MMLLCYRNIMRNPGNCRTDLRCDRARGKTKPTNFKCYSCCGILKFANGILPSKELLLRSAVPVSIKRKADVHTQPATPVAKAKAGVRSVKATAVATSTQPHAAVDSSPQPPRTHDVGYDGTPAEWIAEFCPGSMDVYKDGYFCHPCNRIMSSC